MKTKKGMISAQFNWVFILIAGVLILLFFGSLVLKAKESSEIAIAETMLTNMQTIMTGADVSVKTINSIEIPDEEIKVRCNSLSVGKVSNPITKNKIVFAPEVIDGTTLLAWAFDWNAPYHVTNFLYLTTPNVKYFFVSQDSEAERIFNLLPSKINKKKVATPSEVSSTGNYIKIVFFNEQGMPPLPPNLNNLPNSKVSAINVDTGSNNIEFFRKTGTTFISDGSAGYIRDPMILGAIFSGTFEDYECNVKKAFNKLNIVSMVYRERTNTLKLKGLGGGACGTYYGFPSPTDYSTATITQINADINSIESNNKYLQRFSCPTIY